jgi:Ca2+-binding RTX toxin-like protein
MTTKTLIGTDQAEKLNAPGYTGGLYAAGKQTNTVRAGGGDDTILAGGGKLNADGTDNDMLFGEAGNDVYRFETRWGVDSVADTSGNNRIEFGATVKRSSLTFWRNGADLSVSEAGAGSLLTVTDFFAASSSGAPSSFSGISFADGSTLSVSDVKALLEKSSQAPVPLYVRGSLNNGNYQAALENSAVLNGSPGDDRFESTSANEVFEDYFSYTSGYVGGSRISSGVPRTAFGGSGNDTYVFSGRFGQDRILDVEGVYGSIGTSASDPEQDVIVFKDLLASDLSFYRYFNVNDPFPSAGGGKSPVYDLIIQSRKTADAVTVVNQFTTALDQLNGTVASFGVSHIQFADGTRWDRAMIAQQIAPVFAPPSGVQSVIGTSGNDTLVANNFDTKFKGDQGSDTYVIGRKPFAYVIDSSGNTGSDRDVIRLDVNANDLTWRQTSTDLVLTSGLLSVTVAGYGVADANTVSRLEFADGQTQDLRTFAAGFNFLPTNARRVVVGVDSLVGSDGQDVFSWGVANASPRNSIYSPYLLQQLRPEQGDHILLESTNYGLQLDNAAVVGEFRFKLINGSGEALLVSVPTGSRPLANSDVLIRFTDGSAWTFADLTARLAASPIPPAADAVAVGTDFDDFMWNRSVFRGGRGNDTLEAADATYIYEQGDGDDVVGKYTSAQSRVALQLGAGISLADLRIKDTKVETTFEVSSPFQPSTVYTANLSGEVLTFGASPGSISAIGGITSIQLADGTVLDDVAMAGLRGVLLGRDGNDTLTASSAGQLVNGRGGNDSLSGGVGNDTLIGGLGNDTLSGGAGSDTYQYSVGDGVDLIHADSLDTLSLGFDSFALKIGKLGATVANAVVLTNGTTGDSITLDNAGGWAGLQLKFADGATLTGADILAQASSLSLTGTTKADTLTGKDGNDTLSGLAGNDTLAGGKGNDSLIGGKGNDTYLFNRGEGQDVIVDTDSTFFNSDLLKLGGATSKQLWLTKTGKDLDIKILGTQDKVTVQNWFAGSSNQVEKITASDGKSLSASKVQALVNAMASFTPPADAASLPANTPTAVTKLIASSWT